VNPLITGKDKITQNSKKKKETKKERNKQRKKERRKETKKESQALVKIQIDLEFWLVFYCFLSEILLLYRLAVAIRHKHAGLVNILAKSFVPALKLTV
jgi:hypothetical protein